MVGVYDKAAGVVTVPAASFQTSGVTANDDLKAVLGLQAITVDFSHKTWHDPGGLTHTVNQEMVTNLQSTLNGSPVLAAQIKDAVAQGHVQHLSLLDNSVAAGATYDGSTRDGNPKGINLPPSGLQTFSPGNPQGRFDARDMTFVLGHEIQHGFNDATKDLATTTFLRDIAAQARVGGPLHDYTDELRSYIQAGREDEAKAEIAGWNALLSREQQRSPSFTLVDMGKLPNSRVYDFVTPNLRSSPSSPLPGLTFNPDSSLPQTPANIAAMGQHYFDRPSPNYSQPGQRPVGLGEHKPNPTADYTNFYGAWALEQIVAAEDRANVLHQGVRPQIAIDMAGIGLKEDLIEMEGLDLGAIRTPRPYLDTSQMPAAPSHFHHTQDGRFNPLHDHQYVPVAPSGRIPPGGDPVVERWIEALQDGDVATANAVQQAFARSPEGQRLWTDTLAEAQAEQLRQQPWLAQAQGTPLFNQALDHLDRVGPAMGLFWTGEQREQLAGTIALEARRSHLPRIDALLPTPNGDLVAVGNNPHNRIFDRFTGAIEPTWAAEQPLQRSMQHFNNETERQEQQSSFFAQQRQTQLQSGMSM